MPSRIAHRLESFSDGSVLRAHGATMVEDIDPNRVSAGKYASSGRGAIGSGTVKAIEPQRGSSHLIKVWGLDEWVSIVAHVAPTLVVSHNEDEIGLFRAVAKKGE